MKITANKPDVSQEYKNEFKNTYPFSKIGRCVVDKDSGEIKRWCSSDDSNFDVNGNAINIDNSTEDVMVYFPLFYYKREWQGDELSDSILDIVPTSKEYKGYKVHPAFVRADGTLRPYVLVSAFNGTEIGGQLRSVPSNTKPSVSKTISAFRDLVRQGRDTKWNLWNMEIISMVQLLYKIGFQNLNSQSTMGNGWTGKSESANVGSTMSLGNKSGYLGTNGNQISLFGIEDFYGNIWKFIDGFVVKDDGYYTTNDSTKYGTTSEYSKIEGCGTPLTNTTDNNFVEGYITSIEKPSGREEIFNLPNKLGGSETTYYCDYLWSHRKTQENICLFGASWVDGLRSGAFCLDWRDLASSSWASLGAGTCFLP